VRQPDSAHLRAAVETTPLKTTVIEIPVAWRGGYRPDGRWPGPAAPGRACVFVEMVPLEVRVSTGPLAARVGLRDSFSAGLQGPPGRSGEPWEVRTWVEEATADPEDGGPLLLTELRLRSPRQSPVDELFGTDLDEASLRRDALRADPGGWWCAAPQAFLLRSPRADPVPPWAKPRRPRAMVGTGREEAVLLGGGDLPPGGSRWDDGLREAAIAAAADAAQRDLWVREEPSGRRTLLARTATGPLILGGGARTVFEPSGDLRSSGGPIATLARRLRSVPTGSVVLASGFVAALRTAAQNHDTGHRPVPLLKAKVFIPEAFPERRLVPLVLLGALAASGEIDPAWLSAHASGRPDLRAAVEAARAARLRAANGHALPRETDLWPAADGLDRATAADAPGADPASPWAWLAAFRESLARAREFRTGASQRVTAPTPVGAIAS